VFAAAFAASRSSRRDRLIAPAAGAIGFLAGGVIGWASVPAEWTASLWTTIEAAGNAAKYGESFEHIAEHALMYFFYSAVLAEIAFALGALVVVRVIPGNRLRT
jgi:hypothetical protein